MTRRRRAALLLGLSLLPLPALAQGQGQGQGRGGGPPDRGGGPDRGGPPSRGGPDRNGPDRNGQGRGGNAGVTLGGLEQAIVQSWLRQNPGFAVQPLPPGMRNRLAQGKPLPPGIARRAVPPGLLGQLPVRSGYDYLVIGATLVLVEAATGVVASLLDDAFRR